MMVYFKIAYLKVIMKEINNSSQMPRQKRITHK